MDEFVLSGTIETRCTRCEHSRVCAYKNDYIQITDLLRKTFNQYSEKDIPHMVFSEPFCKFYKEHNKRED